MKPILYIALTALLLLVSTKGKGSDTLRLSSFLEIVNQNHPLIKKANLYDEIHDAYDLKAKGVLDPKIQSSNQSKSFNNTDYFTIWESEVKIPTTLPVDISFGHEHNQGDFLNPERNAPVNGLVYGTLNVTVLRGLMFDDQRYKIKEAELTGIKNQIEKENLIREVVYQGVLTYIDWATTYYELKINRNYFDLVNVRHQNVVSLLMNGDIPAIDTLESKINLNTAEKLWLDSKNEIIKKQQMLSLFVWNDEGSPMQLLDSVSPIMMKSLVYELKNLAQVNSIRFSNDPSIRKLYNKIDQLALSNKLEKENLKPRLDLKYNAIVNLGKDDFSPSINLNDYKYGIYFEYPILNRKSKGEIKLTAALIDQTELDIKLYEARLFNTFNGLNSRIGNQLDLLVVLDEKLQNSKILYEAESLKFELGESSIFLLNNRERQLLESQTELIKAYKELGVLVNDLYYLKLGQKPN